ncbi:MAG: GTP 3',8-cyclase MoaA [Conexivisphaera sp.]
MSARGHEVSPGGTSARPLVDSFGRVIRKVRISVTERCNFRCTYCMPVSPTWFDRESVLRFEEITRLVRILASMGVSKVKMTGGEPLMRKDVEKLVSMIAQVPGVESLSMTTNGFFLEEKARALRDAGLRTVTVSLPSLDRGKFRAITGVDALDRVIRGIDAALDAGFQPVKLNSTIIRGLNDGEIVDLAEFARERGIFIRFIEFMPFDGKGSWSIDRVFSWQEMYESLRQRFDLEPLPRERGSTAMNYAFRGSRGGVGFIASITAPFCDDCERIRLTADGRIVPCMFSPKEFDLKSALRSGAPDSEIERLIREAVAAKDGGVKYMIRSGNLPSSIRPMYVLGG